MSALLHDVRFGLRLLAKSPAFTAGAVLSLTLAIAANTTIFSLVDSILLRPLPVSDQEELVTLHARSQDGSSFHSFSYLDYRDFRQVEAFSEVVAYDLTPMAWSVGEQAEVVQGYVVSDNYFDVLGVDAVLGRTFGPEEGRVPGRDAVAVISHDLWTQRFAGDPGVLGREIKLNSYPFTVIGVAPEGFAGPFHGLAAHLWAPLMMREQLHVGEDLETRNHVWLELIARRAPGVGRQEAQAAVDIAFERLRSRLGEDEWGIAGVDVLPLSPVPATLQGPVTGFMTLLLVLTGLLLLVAAMNVAGMLVARATGRRKEIAIRLSMGSTRKRLARQLLAESLVLFLIASLLGLGLSLFLIQLAPKLLGPTLTDLSLPVHLDLRLDHRVLGFTLLLALVTGTLFGLAPLSQTARPVVLPALQDESGGAAGMRKARLRSALVVAQIAVSLLLLVLAGLLALSLRSSTRIDPGFEPDGVQIMALDLSRHGYNDASGMDFYQRLVERAEALPGVSQAALASTVQLGIESQSTAVTTQGQDEDWGTDLTAVSPGYFGLMGIPIVAGRDFGPADRAGGAPVVIVNEEIARHFWPNGGAVGRTLYDGDVATGEPMQVVGVVPTTKVRRLSEEPSFFIYRPLLQKYRPNVMLMARVDGPPESVVPAIRRSVLAMDPGLPVVNPMPLGDYIGLSLLPQKVATGLAATLGILGLVLVAVGVYALMAYIVTQRVREVGIRMALGAQVRDVVRVMMRRGVILTAAGVIGGLILAFLASKAMSSLLFGVGGSSLAVFAGLAALLTAVGLTASYLPARRSARMNPLRALRHH